MIAILICVLILMWNTVHGASDGTKKRRSYSRPLSAATTCRERKPGRTSRQLATSSQMALARRVHGLLSDFASSEAALGSKCFESRLSQLAGVPVQQPGDHLSKGSCRMKVDGTTSTCHYRMSKRHTCWKSEATLNAHQSFSPCPFTIRINS